MKLLDRRPESMGRLGIFDFVISVGGCGGRVLSSLILAAENPYVVNYKKKTISTEGRFILLNTGLADFDEKKVLRTIDILQRNEGSTENWEGWAKSALSISDDVSDIILHEGAGMSFVKGEEAVVEFVREVTPEEWKRKYERYETIKNFSGFRQEKPSILKYKLDRVGYDPQNSAVLIVSGLGQGTGSGTAWLITQAVRRFARKPVVFNVVILPEGGWTVDSQDSGDSAQGLKCVNLLMALAHLRQSHAEEQKMFDEPKTFGENKQAIFIISNNALSKMLRLLRDSGEQKIGSYSAYNDLITHWFLRPLITTAFDTNDLMTHLHNWGRGSTNNVPIASPATYIPRNPNTNPLMWVANACKSFKFADVRDAKGCMIQFYAHNENVRRRVMQIQNQVEEYIESITGINQFASREADTEFCVLTNFSGVMLLLIGPILGEIPQFKKTADKFADYTSARSSNDVSKYKSMLMQNRIERAIEDIVID